MPTRPTSFPPNAEPCRLCGSAARHLWQGKLLGDLEVGYFECATCGYVQTEEPSWLDRAYSEAINASDTGIMARNQDNAGITLSALMTLGQLRGRVVDYAGGYGILVRLLRDVGVDARWFDVHCANLVAKGFEHRGEAANLVTAFEAFEHFVRPEEEMSRMLAIAPNILFSTAIIPDPAPSLDRWWYYGREHGQHIGFFRLRTLQRLAATHGKFLVSDGNLYHLFTETPVSPLVWKATIRTHRLLAFLSRRLLTPRTTPDRCALVEGGRIADGPTCRPKDK